MDYRTYQKIRAYCWPDLADYLDTPAQREGIRKIARKLHGLEGVIADEGESARKIIEEYRDFTPRQHAAAVLLHFASNHYLAAVNSKCAPPEKAEELEPLTLDAVDEYGAFLPEREAAALRAACTNAPKGAPWAPAAPWIPTARAIGKTWMQQQEKKTGKRPIVREISLYVADELSSRGIKGPRGKFLDAETIAREALTGITGRKKGDNLRKAR